jgi:hypothetical protein
MKLYLGRDDRKNSVWVPTKSFDTHWHIIGGTGKGKTTSIIALLIRLLMSRSDVAHFLFCRLGGLSDLLLQWISSPYCPDFIRNRVVYIDAAREDVVPTFNPLLYDSPAHGYFKTQRAGDVILRAWASQNIEEMPRLARWVFNAIWAVAQLGLTVADCAHLLMPGSSLHDALIGCLPDTLRAEWAEITNARNGEASRILESSRNRLKPFFENPILRCMFGSTRNRLDVRRFMQEGKIVIINLSPQNRLSSQLADAIGGMLLNEILATARSQPPDEKYPTYVWLDEFQRFVGPDMDEAIPEVRQLGVKLVLSHQSFSQLERNGVDLTSLIWQPQSRMICGLQGEDADLLGHELAALQYDPKRVKDEVYTKRQLLAEQRVIRLASWTEAEQEAENWQKTHGSSWNSQSSHATNRGWNQGDSDHASVARRYGVPNDLRTAGKGRSQGTSGGESDTTSNGEGGSESNARGGSRSTTSSVSVGESVLPVYETFDELSRRSYYTLDEQAAIWAREIRQLKTGQAFLRIVDDPTIYRVNVERHAPGYLSWDRAKIKRVWPQAFDQMQTLIEDVYCSDVFTTPALIERETAERLQQVLNPRITLGTVVPACQGKLRADETPLL